LGTRQVLQGHDGELTHKDLGRYAWGFIVRDAEGKQCRGLGLELVENQWRIITDDWIFLLDNRRALAGVIDRSSGKMVCRLAELIQPE